MEKQESLGERVGRKAADAADASVDAFGGLVEKAVGTERVEAAINTVDAIEGKLDEKMAPVEKAIDNAMGKALDALIPSDRETWLTRLLDKFFG